MCYPKSVGGDRCNVDIQKQYESAIDNYTEDVTKLMPESERGGKDFDSHDQRQAIAMACYQDTMKTSSVQKAMKAESRALSSYNSKSDSIDKMVGKESADAVLRKHDKKYAYQAKKLQELPEGSPERKKVEMSMKLARNTFARDLTNGKHNEVKERLMQPESAAHENLVSERQAIHAKETKKAYHRAKLANSPSFMVASAQYSNTPAGERYQEKMKALALDATIPSKTQVETSRKEAIAASKDWKDNYDESVPQHKMSNRDQARKIKSMQKNFTYNALAKRKAAYNASNMTEAYMKLSPEDRSKVSTEITMYDGQRLRIMNRKDYSSFITNHKDYDKNDKQSIERITHNEFVHLAGSKGTDNIVAAYNNNSKHYLQKNPGKDIRLNRQGFITI